MINKLNVFLRKYERLFTIACIGSITISISAGQLWVANSQVNLNEKLSEYKLQKAKPQIDVIRYNDEKDTVKVVNYGSEVVSVKSGIITILYAQVSTDEGVKSQNFVVKPIRDKFTKLTDDSKVILVSTSDTSYEELNTKTLNFAVNMRDEHDKLAAINFTTYIKLGYQNLGGTSVEKYFRLSNPSSATYESDQLKAVYENVYTNDNYQIIFDNQDPIEVVEAWILRQ